MKLSILLWFAIAVAVTTPRVDGVSFSRHRRAFFDTPMVAPPPPAPAPTAASMLPKIVASIKAGAAPETNNTGLDSFVNAIRDTTKLVGANGTLTPAKLEDFVTKVVASLGSAVNASAADQGNLKTFVTTGLINSTHDIDGVVKQLALGADLLDDALRVPEILKELVMSKQVYVMGFPVTLPDVPDDVISQALVDLNSIIIGFGFSPDMNFTPIYTSALNNGGVPTMSGMLGGQGAVNPGDASSLFSKFMHVNGGFDLSKMMTVAFGGDSNRGAAKGSPFGSVFDLTQMLGGLVLGSLGSGGPTPAVGGLDLVKLFGGGKPAGGGPGGLSLASVVGNIFGGRKNT